LHLFPGIGGRKLAAVEGGADALVFLVQVGELWLRGSQDHACVAWNAMCNCTEQAFRVVRTASLASPTKVPSLRMGLVDLFVTCAGQVEADSIRSALLSRRLIACGNTWPVMSKFRWDDGIETASEVMLLVKTTRERQAEVVDLVSQLHSYDVPAISVVQVEAGSVEYERWVIESTQP
jgi:periplasmic divalent cation tolerance protein